MLQIIVDYGAMALVLAFLVWQILVPLWRGTKMLPLVRREGTLEREIAAANQARREAELVEELKQVEQQQIHHSPECIAYKAHAARYGGQMGSCVPGCPVGGPSL